MLRRILSAEVVIIAAIITLVCLAVHYLPRQMQAVGQRCPHCGRPMVLEHDGYFCPLWSCPGSREGKKTRAAPGTVKIMRPELSW